MKVTWEGIYKFDNPRIQKMVGFDHTNYTIIIDNFDTQFEGTVTDDISTGGMEGIGKIIGSLKGTSISFKKFMPVGDRFIDWEGNREKTNKKHSTLYYSGTLSANGKEASGSWTFGYKLGFLFGFIPLPYHGGKGTWSMQKA